MFIPDKCPICFDKLNCNETYEGSIDTKKVVPILQVSCSNIIESHYHISIFSSSLLEIITVGNYTIINKRSNDKSSCRLYSGFNKFLFESNERLFFTSEDQVKKIISLI